MTVLASTSGRLCERLQHVPDVVVDLALELDVEVQEFEPFGGRFGSREGDRAERRGGRFLEGALQPRLAPLVQQLGGLVVGRQSPGEGLGGCLGGDAIAPQVPPRDVVGVDERHRRAPRFGVVGVLEPFGEHVGDVGVALPALAGGAVRGRVHPTREPVFLQRRTARQRRPAVVAVGQVPLAEPVGVVAVLAQHRAPGGKSGVERAAARDHAARLVGVQTRQQRRAGGGAVVRGRVVVGEADAAFAQLLQVRGEAEAEGARRRPTAGSAAGRPRSRGCWEAPRAGSGWCARSSPPAAWWAAPCPAESLLASAIARIATPAPATAPPAISPRLRNVRRSTRLPCFSSLLAIGPVAVRCSTRSRPDAVRA